MKANMIEALNSERAGLQARLDAAGESTPADKVTMLTRRIAEIGDQLDDKPARGRAKKETRPAAGAAEKRPG